MNSKNLTGAPGQRASADPGRSRRRTPPQRFTGSQSPLRPRSPTSLQPVYTEEAKQMHLEGAVSVQHPRHRRRRRQVVGVTHGLGHGLDESAMRAIQGTRFTPALDTTGHPVDWEGVVNVNFQMAG